MKPETALLAYADRQSARPTEAINFKVSAEGIKTYEAQVVRLLSPEVGPGPHTPEFKEVEIDSPISGEHPAQWQPIYPGSYVRILPNREITTPDGFTLLLSVFPTLLASGRQGLISSYAEEAKSGIGLFLEPDGRLGLLAGNGTKSDLVFSEIALEENRWTSIAVALRSSGEVRFQIIPLQSHRLEARGWRSEECRVSVETKFGSSPILLGALGTVDNRVSFHFNGRIERPRVVGRFLEETEIAELAMRGPTGKVEGTVADWDFSIGIDGEEVVDVSGNELNGRVEQMPTRAVGGSNWSGETVDWRARPEEYGAIHFHEDDLLDAGWDTSITLTVPEDWPSGCYATRFRANESEFYVPFVVRPPTGPSTAKVLFILPTATYCAYANLRLRVTGDWNELIHGRLTVLDETDLLMLRFPELGLCTYDSHSDGSTVVHSSMHRPVTNFRPKGRIYKFCQDLLIVAWLEELGVSFDVISDEDLHHDGIEILEPYSVVITSSHHEYVSTEILDALESFARGGGRLMNLGGNVFWHRIAYHPSLGGVTEVRRPDLPRLWRADASQGHHSFTGEPAGTWVGLGRAPHLLAGHGFITQGFDTCSYYRRTTASFDPRADFIFEGVGDEIIGDFGLLQGGAAGYEIDRADTALGTPNHAMVVASSENHSNLYGLMVTALADMLPVVEQDVADRIRADMVFFETEGGGAVFSVGSIAWSGSLSYSEYENNVARITENVLSRFMDPEPFEMPICE